MRYRGRGLEGMEQQDLDKRQMTIKTIDLFSGIGGMRLGFERACKSLGIDHFCVFSSDIKKTACEVYRYRFGDIPDPFCDITKVDENLIPDFDVLLGGFPCQAFSKAGSELGFQDTRGTLFFDVARIIKAKRPTAFLLENVSGLLNHDHRKTIKVILNVLDQLGYHVYFKVLNSKDFGVPQKRPRIYIVGFDKRVAGRNFSFPEIRKNKTKLVDILESEPDDVFFITQTYWEWLLKHKQHHQDLGHGFGYSIQSPFGLASTLVAGGMGMEGNLIKDTTDRILPINTNSERIRVMTPIEWERLQGFEDNWTDIVSRTARMSLLGNSVTVNVIEAISCKIIKELTNKEVPVQDSIFD